MPEAPKVLSAIILEQNFGIPHAVAAMPTRIYISLSLSADHLTTSLWTGLTISLQCS